MSKFSSIWSDWTGGLTASGPLMLSLYLLILGVFLYSFTNDAASKPRLFSYLVILPWLMAAVISYQRLGQVYQWLEDSDPRGVMAAVEPVRSILLFLLVVTPITLVMNYFKCQRLRKRVIAETGNEPPDSTFES